MNSYFFTIDEVLNELDSIRSGALKAWPELGKLFLSVEHHGFWRKTNKSFSEWVRDFARSQGKSESSYWRLVSSSRYYVQLRDYLITHGVDAPLLEDLSEFVSPENLELMSKIERVLPADQRLTLAKKVVLGNATRSELRDFWSYYKPLLEGRNARGNVDIPKYEEDNPDHQQSLVKANILKELANTNGAWLRNHSKANLTLVDLNLPMQSNNNKLKSKGININLISTFDDDDGDFLIHGVEVIGLRSDQSMELLKLKTKYFDYFWLAVHEDFVGELIGEPREIGVVSMNKYSQFEIKRPAIKRPITQDELITTLKMIIKKLSR